MMQGLDMPDVELCSASELPPPMTRPSSPPSPPMDPLLFEEPEDTYGRASVRMRTGSTSLPDPPPIDTIASTSSMASTSTNTEIYSDVSTSMITVSPAEVSVPAETDNTSSAVTIVSPASTNSLSRTTLWRRKKQQDEASQGDDGPPTKKRKVYTCSKCGQPKTG